MQQSRVRNQEFKEKITCEMCARQLMRKDLMLTINSQMAIAYSVDIVIANPMQRPKIGIYGELKSSIIGFGQ